MKISRKTHLTVLTALFILGVGAIPAAVVGWIFPVDTLVPWFSGSIPLNMFVFTNGVFIASFLRKQIFAKLETYIFGEDQTK